MWIYFGQLDAPGRSGRGGEGPLILTMTAGMQVLATGGDDKRVNIWKARGFIGMQIGMDSAHGSFHFGFSLRRSKRVP